MLDTFNLRSRNKPQFMFNYRLTILLSSLCWLVACYTPVNAQAPFLAGTANKSTVGLNEQLQISYTLNTNGRSFQGPDLKDFTVLSGPNQSTSMQFVNGNISQSISFSYYLQPKAIGNFKIGPASIETDGKRIASNVIQITVVKGSAPAQQGTQGGQNNRQQQAQDNGGLTDKNIFARAQLSKSTAQKGESVILTYKLYANVTITDYATPKMPSLDGFWSQDIQLPQNLARTTEVVDGQRYTVWEIKKMVLFPQQAGTLTIDPMELECLARVRVQSQRSNDPFSIFSDPFFGMGGVRDVKYSFKSQTIKLQVKELPAPAPADFAGAVGSMKFTATVDRTTTKANEPISLKIKISGNGNLKLADVNTPEMPPDFEVYDPKTTDNYKVSEQGVNGTKTIEYLIIPRHEGDYEIPAIGFSYYDLGKKQYVSETAGPFRIKVGKGNGTVAAGISAEPGEKSEFKMMGNDIRYIKVNAPDFSERNAFRFGTPLFYTMAILPFLLFGGAAGWVRYQHKLSGNLAALKMKNATGVARKRLANARKLMNGPNDQQVFEEMHKAVWGYLGDKFTIPPALFSREHVTEILSSQRIRPELITQVMDCIDQCELARYGGSYAGIKAEALYTKTAQVITALEEEANT